jgi:hypothetical protein
MIPTGVNALEIDAALYKESGRAFPNADVSITSL